MKKTTGSAPFTFVYREDLRALPAGAASFEPGLHGGFAVDGRPGHGHVYYGMPGHGLVRTSPDLARQETIELPPELRPMNFHSTRIGLFDGKLRMILPANEAGKVAVVSLEGELDHVFGIPEFSEYRREGVAFAPTDVALANDNLYVADGYGANYISVADPGNREWTSIFGGKTEDPLEKGKFGTAHGITADPSGERLAIADRPHSRIQLSSYNGTVTESRALPAGSLPCGIDYRKIGDSWFAVVASLEDPDRSRPAPIYILDGETYEVLSTLRPKEDLGLPLADHIHNAIWHEHAGTTYLVCQAWNPGYYFVLEMTSA
jgi:hypothetical protein